MPAASSASGELAADRALELGARDPVVAQRLDVPRPASISSRFATRSWKTPASMALYSSWVCCSTWRRSGSSDGPVVVGERARVRMRVSRAADLRADRDGERRRAPARACAAADDCGREARLALVEDRDAAARRRPDRPHAASTSRSAADAEAAADPRRYQRVRSRASRMPLIRWRAAARSRRCVDGQGLEAPGPTSVGWQIGEARCRSAKPSRAPESHQRRQLLAILDDGASRRARGRRAPARAATRSLARSRAVMLPASC